MRAYSRSFPIWNAVRTELSWTHYRLLSRIKEEHKKQFYLTHSIEKKWMGVGSGRLPVNRFAVF